MSRGLAYYECGEKYKAVHSNLIVRRRNEMSDIFTDGTKIVLNI
jgi:hypothetical protein